MNRRIDAPSSRERVVLSEVLPYEVTPHYSNRRFYQFLVAHEVRYEDSEVSWKRGTREIERLVKILFGVHPNSPVIRRSLGRVAFALAEKDYSIPYTFRVAKNDDEFRSLSIPHPRHQVAMIDFYARHSQDIVYNAGRSPFSIRRPVRISKYAYMDDQLHAELRATWAPSIAESRAEYETFRSYFAYERYSNIYKFYESTEYQEAEKRYRHLLKLDVSKCFESIYTHSIAWAIYGKDSIKEHVRSKGAKTFPEEFDRLLQRLNYNETNGILVGPEFSRLFAETIMQEVDLATVRDLERRGIRQGTDYQVIRYVDDFFVFYDAPDHESKIRDAIATQLKDYGLHLNHDKQSGGPTPEVSPISVAKERAKVLFGEAIGGEGLDLLPNLDGRRLTTAYKTIVRETGVSASDILNYSLSVLERRTVRFLVQFAKSRSKSDQHYERLVSAICDVLRLSFFIYSAAPRVNPTVKLCRIVDHATSYVSNHRFTPGQRRQVFDVIRTEVLDQLTKAHTTGQIQVEKLYLLSCLTGLGRDYLLTQEELMRIFAIRKAADGTLTFGLVLDHFALTSLMHYAQARHRYADLRSAIEVAWVERVDNLNANSTERVLLILDSLESPFLEQATKLRVLHAAGITARVDRERLITASPGWFVKWRNFEFGEELDLKRNQEVY